MQNLLRNLEGKKQLQDVFMVLSINPITIIKIEEHDILPYMKSVVQTAKNIFLNVGMLFWSMKTIRVSCRCFVSDFKSKDKCL